MLYSKPLQTQTRRETATLREAAVTKRLEAVIIECDSVWIEANSRWLTMVECSLTHTSIIISLLNYGTDGSERELN